MPFLLQGTHRCQVGFCFIVNSLAQESKDFAIEHQGGIIDQAAIQQESCYAKDFIIQDVDLVGTSHDEFVVDHTLVLYAIVTKDYNPVKFRVGVMKAILVAIGKVDLALVIAIDFEYNVKFIEVLRIQHIINVIHFIRVVIGFNYAHIRMLLRYSVQYFILMLNFAQDTFIIRNLTVEIDRFQADIEQNIQFNIILEDTLAVLTIHMYSETESQVKPSFNFTLLQDLSMVNLLVIFCFILIPENVPNIVTTDHLVDGKVVALKHMDMSFARLKVEMATARWQVLGITSNCQQVDIATNCLTVDITTDCLAANMTTDHYFEIATNHQVANMTIA